MALADLTQQSVLEAGIAASLNADAELLPEPSIYFQDFNFGLTMWDAAYGNVDGGNVSGVGEAVADIAIDNRLLAEIENRKKDEPDAMTIAEFGAETREELAKLQQIDVGGITLSAEEWEDIRETLNDPEKAQAVKDSLMAQGKSEAEANEIIYLTRMAANIAEKKASGQPLTAEEQAVEQKLKDDPDTRAKAETGAKTSQEVGSRSPSDLEVGDFADARVSGVQDDASFSAARASTLDDASLVSANVAARSGISTAGNPFEVAYKPSPDFNMNAAGVQIAAVAPSEAPTTPKSELPSLANI